MSENEPFLFVHFCLMAALPGPEIGWYSNTLVKRGYAQAVPVGLGILLARLLVLAVILGLPPETFRFLETLPNGWGAYFIVAGIAMVVASLRSFNDAVQPQFARKVTLGILLTLTNPITLASMYVVTAHAHGRRYEMDDPMQLLMHAVLGVLLALLVHGALAALVRKILGPAMAAQVMWIGLGLLSMASGVAVYLSR